ncbi:UNVERIFIED_CONTAM: hypothetical protein PYX00_004045 [Menopon gallinae]|uniref:Uncharacterized protein n=1 Tax=Menopon gallinae TaxID=328185 RepID=A0AAW2I364_9NEOP
MEDRSPVMARDRLGMDPSVKWRSCVNDRLFPEAGTKADARRWETETEASMGCHHTWSGKSHNKGRRRRGFWWFIGFCTSTGQSPQCFIPRTTNFLKTIMLLKGV